MRRWGLAVLVLIVAFSCSSPKFPGYKKVEDHLYFKLLSFSDASSVADSCDVFEVYVSSTDSALMQQFSFSTRDNLPNWISKGHTFLDSLQPYLAHMNPGDSAEFIVDRPDTTPVNMSVWWRECYSQPQFDDAHEAWVSERGLREGNRIRHFALDKGFSSSVVHPSVIYRIVESGEGAPLNYGDQIAVHYTGHFLNGALFDDSELAGEPLIFELGTDGQVIAGLEYGLIGARPGESRWVVIPAAFAFGEKGSSTGIVPPYTPVWYKVQILAEPES